MMSTSRYYILLILITLSGCTSSLKQWTQEELSPYLAKELGEHPRFKQQPIMLVDMQGEQVEAQIDNLTTEIRDQVFNSLLQSKGTHLIWQSSTTSLQHHTRLQDIQCRPKQKTRYYIGFDLKPINDQFQLSVKALDPEQGRWISGFGKTWQGSLSRQEQQRLKQTHPDEILRGLRPLPFTELQMDLLASYLAKNISCLLQQSGLDELYIYSSNDKLQPVFMNNAVALVSNYLSRFNEVNIVNKADKANIILKAEIHRIDNNLHQFWLIAQDKQKDEHIRGIDTTAYVTLSETALQISKPTQKPVNIPVVQKPVSVIPPVSESANLFNTLNLISPIGEPFCHTTNPWAMGEYPIKTNQSIAHCFGLKISLKEQAEVFLINEDSLGHYYQLLPDMGQTNFKLFAGEQLRYPENDLLDLASNVTNETIHAIAISDPFIANKLHQLLQSMPVCCDSEGTFDKAFWHSRLETFRSEHKRLIDWQTIRVKH